MMDYEAYRQAYFAQPQPVPRYEFSGMFGFALFFAAYDRALSYYSEVLGPPGYVEGEYTRGWLLGDLWLTLLPAESGDPGNVELQLVMTSQKEAERLHDAFIKAGGIGQEPVDTLMYEPLRLYPVSDPFGTKILIIARPGS